ncbi:hypothetical protein HII28_19830 [Planctomonas sp. JC2975]|nr:hypothetical protein [Planctomonas sp. JC2975]
MAKLIGRKKLPEGTDVFIGQCLTHHVQTLTEYRADTAIGSFLGLTEATYRRREAGNLLADTPTRARHIALAVVLSAREAQAADEHCWRSVREAVSSYLLALEGWGYHLSDVERLAAGYPEQD